MKKGVVAALAFAAAATAAPAAAQADEKASTSAARPAIRSIQDACENSLVPATTIRPAAQASPATSSTAMGRELGYG
jgi:hypothetical protein